MQELVRRRLLRALDSPSHHKQRFDTTELLAELGAYSRQPYIEILGEILQAVPTPEALQTFADAHPDRWANAIKSISNLAGFHDKLEIHGNVNLDIKTMGDAQLMERIKQVEGKLKEMGMDAKVVEGKVGEKKDK